MSDFFNTPFYIGALRCSNRLIQGPLAGFSCAPFRVSFSRFMSPAYCVSEMISAQDVVIKHPVDSRYLYRAPEEKTLCYQISGYDPVIMAQAAQRLQDLGADLIDLNCGCPKTKIRKKGAGSALLDVPTQLQSIVTAVRQVLHIPLTVKLRIQGDMRDVMLAKMLEESGVDGLIVHGRRWIDAYDIPCDVAQIGRIKQAVKIPVIANGDIFSVETLASAHAMSACDAYMISRGGSGHPWLYQQLLASTMPFEVDYTTQMECFMQHLHELACLENEHQAVLQSKSLARYYMGNRWSNEQWPLFYSLQSLNEIDDFLKTFLALPKFS